MRGQIRKRGKKYSIVVQIEDEKGIKKPKWISGYNTKKEAEDDLPRILTEIKGGVFVSDKITFGEFADKWLKHVKTKVKESTYLTYVWAMDKLKERFSAVQIERIKPIAIQDFLDSQTISPTSIHYQFSVLVMAFDQAIKWQLLAKNPCDNVTPPPKSKKKFNPYTDEQIQTLLNGAKKTSIYIPVLLALTCGFRRGEICDLEWKDINFDQNEIFISDGKTDNAARCVAAPEFVIEELRKMRGIGKVVVLKPDYVYKAFVKLVKALKLPLITFHDLRHLHCSLLIKAGVPLTAISARAGHSSKSFTLNKYGHLLPDKEDKAVTVMDSILTPIAK